MNCAHPSHVGRSWILAAPLLVFLSFECPAGYRNVDTQPATSSPALAPAAAWGTPEIVSTNGQRATVGRSKVFHQQKIAAGESVRVVLRRADLVEGEKVFVYTINGGRVNGSIVTNIAASHGRIEFDFTAGRNFGNYPVAFRCRGQETSIEFWVDADAPKPSGKVAP